ncbi:anthocyanidin 3-O-glucosyltransferase 7 [Selaginella moellendorffii]|nr:anthocyanidin 3-O-glucosyltransferase 7 [Selaginella moellendorffii]|eukprot:XP_002987282.2 anthocyanidin 3-O-glucosyltransferase 7 [Selaginella moellendorffii]
MPRTTHNQKHTKETQNPWRFPSREMAPMVVSSNNGDNGKRSHPPHLVFLPFKDKGHIAPSMILANKLAILHGISITMIFVSEKELESSPSPASPQIKFVVLDTQGGTRSKSEALTAKLDELKRSASPPIAILVDIIVMWSVDAIERSKLPKFSLYTASCSYLSVMLGIRAELPEPQIDESRAGFQPRIDDPEMPDFGSHDWKRDLGEVQGVLVNSCEELERQAMEELIRARPRIPPVLPVGPLLAIDADSPNPKAVGHEPSPPNAEACKQWLDEQEPSSVIFVSFGSRTFLGEEQIRELATGLEASKRPFLWVLPVPPHWADGTKEYLDHVLPDGFLARNQGGLILSGWAPQKMILQHSSLLAFVTHCGWNSVLECLYLGAKPMLCWPFGADQPENARFIEEEIKAGVELEKDCGGIVRSGEIQTKIDEVARLEARNSCGNAATLKEYVRNAPSSAKNLQAFAEALSQM